MKSCGVATVSLALTLLLAACHKPKDVTVDATRTATMADDGMKLDAADRDRFQDPREFPFAAGIVPDGWTEEPGDSFRLLNFRFGEGGEVAVGKSQGGNVLANVNRWLGQFKAQEMTPAALNSLETVHVLGLTGVWIEAEGEYAGGMGREPKAGQALAGVIATDGSEIITVKMTGPREEVAAQKNALRAFLRGIYNR